MIVASSLLVGSRPRFVCSFYDATTVATPADPTTVAVTIQSPSGAQSTYTYAGGAVVRDDVGAYHFDLTVSTAGTWLARWVGAGAIVAVAETSLLVTASSLT